MTRGSGRVSPPAVLSARRRETTPHPRRHAGPVDVTATLAGAPPVTFMATAQRLTLTQRSGDRRERAGQTCPEQSAGGVGGSERHCGDDRDRHLGGDRGSGACRLPALLSAPMVPRQPSPSAPRRAPVEVTATLAGAPPVTFMATALPTNGDVTLTKESGDDQGDAQHPLDRPLVVVLAANGQRLSNRTVSWQVTSGAGTLATGTTTTNGEGRTQNTLTLGSGARRGPDHRHRGRGHDDVRRHRGAGSRSPAGHRLWQ